MFKYLMRFKVQSKIWVIVGLALAGVFVTAAVDVFQLKENLLAEKKLKTRHLVEAAFAVLVHHHDLQQKGLLSEDEARKAAIQTIKAMRYEKTEYFWINDFTAPVPKMVMHPTVPALDGTVLDADKFNKATTMQAGSDGPIQPIAGKNLFVAFNEVANAAGHGYVSYVWPKPLAGGGATSELFPKMSYVKKFEGWNWLIGSGIYIDDLDAIFWSEVKRHALNGAMLLLVLLGMSAVLARSIIKPLKITAGTMHDIAEGDGDLSKRLPVMCAGVTTELAQGFNKFSSKIEQTIVAVSGATLQLAAAASQLSNVADQTAEGVKLQQAETAKVATAIEEMAAKVTEVEQHASNAADAARQADAEAVNGRQVVSETIESINGLAGEVNNAAQVIHKLEAGSRNIGSILEAIRGIADQTNLLALNAAIEAARAGEQGRGFAVVADEVRTLAQRTQDATRQIQEMIGGLQADAQQAARVMEEGQQRAGATVQQAALAGESLAKITRAVNAITAMNQQIADSAQAQGGVVRNIDLCITNITAVAEQTAIGAHDTQAAIGELGQLMAKLQGLVRQFKTYADKGFDFSTAKAAHLAWKARLRSFLDGQSVLTMEQAVSDHHCMLGKWYYGDGMAKYGHVPEMREIEAPHAEMHRTIKDIVAARQAGKTADAERLFATIEPLSQRIVGLIDGVERRVRAA